MELILLAGPSEVLVLADKTANPAIIAADLLAQSEHDKLAKGILVTTDRQLGLDVIEARPGPNWALWKRQILPVRPGSPTVKSYLLKI